MKERAGSKQPEKGMETLINAMAREMARRAQGRESDAGLLKLVGDGDDAVPLNAVRRIAESVLLFRGDDVGARLRIIVVTGLELGATMLANVEGRAEAGVDTLEDCLNNLAAVALGSVDYKTASDDGDAPTREPEKRSD